jgi:hypothetical protein
MINCAQIGMVDALMKKIQIMLGRKNASNVDVPAKSAYFNAIVIRGLFLIIRFWGQKSAGC